MTPTTAKDCLLHCRARMKPWDYVDAIIFIDRLVAAECAIAVQEMHEAQLRQTGALLYKPLSENEVRP